MEKSHGNWKKPHGNWKKPLGNWKKHLGHRKKLFENWKKRVEPLYISDIKNIQNTLIIYPTPLNKKISPHFKNKINGPKRFTNIKKPTIYKYNKFI